MSEPFIAEVRMWALNFPPRGWAFCDGQLLQIAQNTALFSIVGTSFGGDGRVTVGLPDLKDRAVMGVGSGPGLSRRRLGQKVGSETSTTTPLLTGIEISRELSHVESKSTSTFTEASYVNTNRTPSLGINFAIALIGLYPSRS